MKTALIPNVKQIEYISKGNSVNAAEFALSDKLKTYVPKAHELFEGCGAKQIVLKTDDSLAQEEYRLRICTGDITVIASTPAGAYYALCTFKQLCDINDGTLLECEIHDWPDMTKRGFSDDISRGQISTLDDFKRIVRRLSLIKANIYMPYIEDSMELMCIPQSGKFSDPVKQAEFRELVEYARDYYVKIIPIINVLGHWDKNGVLQAFDGVMLHDGDDPAAATTHSLDARKPETREMVKKILDEAIDIFGEAGTIHVGGDEVFEYNRIFGKEKASEYYNDYFKFVHEYLKSKGMKMMMYSDMYTPLYGDYFLPPEALNDMPDDIEFVYWDYSTKKHYNGIDQLIDSGKKFYVSSATISWDRFLPHCEQSWLNTKLLANQAGSRSSGLIMSSWCDGGTNLREENWFGYYSAAMFAWDSSCSEPFTDTLVKFFKLFYGLDIDIAEYKAMTSYEKGFAPEKFNEETDEGPAEMWENIAVRAGNWMYGEFFKPAWEPVDAKLKKNMCGALEKFLRAEKYFSSLKPIRNADTYGVFLFDIRRCIAAAEKFELMREGAYKTREEAMADIPAILTLAEKVEDIMDEHRRLWFETNRASEWELQEGKYLDLRDSLYTLARYCKCGKRMRPVKKL